MRGNLERQNLTFGPAPLRIFLQNHSCSTTEFVVTLDVLSNIFIVTDINCPPAVFVLK